MRLFRRLVTIVPVLALSACMAVPVAEYDDASLSCNTYTHSMTLKAVEWRGGNLYCNDEACLAMILAVSAGSVVVSGSIVLTNNTLHWLEYQGSCDDGYLKIAMRKFFNSLGNPKPVAAKAL
jgi:hypothetical protein